MPVPKRNKGESNTNFMNRCIRFLESEGMPHEQAIAICFDQLRDIYNIVNQEQSSDPDLDPTKFNDEDDLIKGVYTNKYNANKLQNSLYEHHYLNNEGGVGLGFGLPEDFPKNSLRWESAMSYKQNIEFFSGSKTWQQTVLLRDSVFDADGKKLPFAKFKEVAKEINKEYNVNWLRTEQNGAFRISQSAESWHIFQEEKELFPMLKYQTVADGRVRPEHAAYDNIVKPVNDSFWDTRMPPNDWGCRCIAIQLRDGEPTNLNEHLESYNKRVPKEQRVDSLKNPSKVFNNNPGKSGVIYARTKHPYFTVPQQFKSAQKRNFDLVTPSDEKVKQTMKNIK